MHRDAVSTAFDLLTRCAPAGVGVRAEGDAIRVSWRSVDAVTRTDLRRLLIENKSAVIDALRETPTGPADPRWIVDVLASEPAAIAVWLGHAERELHEHDDVDVAGWRGWRIARGHASEPATQKA